MNDGGMRQLGYISLNKGQREKWSKNEMSCEEQVTIESSPLEKMWLEVFKTSENQKTK